MTTTKTEELVSGVFETMGRGPGRLRSPETNYRVDARDPIVPQKLIERANLRGGEMISGILRPSGNHQRGRAPELGEIQSVNDLSVDEHLDVKPFEDLIAIDPRRAVRLEVPGGPVSMRVVDLMTPIGFGQRGLIVAPPRTGKTILLQQIAAGLAANHPDVYMMVLLIDERPEEVTEMRRTVLGEVVASSNDHDVASHVRLARLMMEKAKRLVESGRDVFVLLDSLTRLGRAFNTDMRGGGGRTMSGGLDHRALTVPKSLFGAARNVEDGGSLTIMATALIETGSRMDDVIFNEFKGTGNMEIMLSRDMANKRIWPAIDLNQSGTRKEELLLSAEALEVAHRSRRSLSSRQPDQAMQAMIDGMNACADNAAFIAKVAASQGRN